MKPIVLIALFIVGVTSDQTEVTSAASLTPASSTLSTSLKVDQSSSNRRDGVSYSTSVIHRDPNHPEQEAESSIDFRLNTGDHHKENPSVSSAPTIHHSYHEYTTAKPVFQQSAYQPSSEYSSQVSDEVESTEQESHGDVVYGQNAVSQAHQPYQAPQAQNHPRQQTHQTHQPHQTHQQQHSNHQPYYKPLSYGQPVFTETKHNIEVLHPTPQYKHSTIVHKTLSTSPRPRTAPQVHHRPARPVQYHSSHSQQSPKAQTSKSTPHQQSQSNHGSHSSQRAPTHQAQTSQLVPQAQAYTQAIYPKPEVPGKSAKSIASFGSSQPTQSQSFNVGYSVKFGTDHNGQKKPFKAPRLESDIITGSHKEEVSKPFHLRFHDDQSKFTYAASNPQQILSQANLTPKTQKQLAFLENIQTHKFVHKEPVQSNFPWKNLSPSVEIYKSKEISLPGSTKNSYGFDHGKAIGKSEGFDYTNAVDFMQQVQAQQGQLTHHGQEPHGYQPGQETQQIQVQAHVQLDPQTDAQTPYLQISDVGHPGSAQDKIPALPKLPIDTSLLREPFLTVHKGQIQGHGHGHQGQQLPIHFDTTLIQEMGKGYSNIFNDGFNGQIGSVSSAGPSSAYSDNLAQINNLLAEQSQHQAQYQQLVPGGSQHSQASAPPTTAQTAESQSNLILVQQQPHQTDMDMTFSYPQNGLFNPNLHNHMVAVVQKPAMDATQATNILFTPNNLKSIDPELLKHIKMYKVKENIQDHVQPQQIKFKVFGKPGNTFMRHQYEKMRHDRPIRIQGHLHASPKRLIREYTNIEMDLRPPPMAIPFKTANFIRIKQ